MGDFDHDTATDLAVGVPHEDLLDGALQTVPDAGVVQVLMGSTGFGGLRAADNQFWNQNSPGIQFWNQDSPGIIGGIENGDAFGHASAGP